MTFISKSMEDNMGVSFDYEFLWFMFHYLSTFLILIGIGIIGMIVLIVLLLKL